MREYVETTPGLFFEKLSSSAGPALLPTPADILLSYPPYSLTDSFSISRSLIPISIALSHTLIALSFETQALLTLFPASSLIRERTWNKQLLCVPKKWWRRRKNVPKIPTVFRSYSQEWLRKNYTCCERNVFSAAATTRYRSFELAMQRVCRLIATKFSKKRDKKFYCVIKKKLLKLGRWICIKTSYGENKND